MAKKNAGEVTGGVRALLRLEGTALFLCALAVYWHLGASWWMLALLFLAPDLSFLAYLAGPRIGATVYNAAHSIIGPVLLATAGLLAAPILIAPALIWLAHIGMDRALGYGLKYAAGFAFTHLGRISRGPGRT